MGVRKPNGELRWISINSQPVFRPGESSHYAVIATFHDVTEQKLAEQAQAASEHTLRVTLDGLTGNIALLDQKGEIMHVNKAWRDFARSNSADLTIVCVGANYLEICRQTTGPDADLARRFAAGIEDVVAGRADYFEAEYACNSPEKERWFTGRVTPVPGSVPRRVVISHEDITIARLAAQALQQSEASLNGIINAAMDAIIVINEVQEIVLFNPAAENIFGYSAGEIIGRPLAILLPERYRSAHQAHIEAFTRTGITRRYLKDIALYGLRAGGTEFRLEAAISKVSVGDQHLFMAITRDISEQLELEQQFFQAQKMEAVGLLAGGIAHDFNNLLVPIMMYASMGLLRLPREHQVYDYLTGIKESVEQATQLASQILALSRKQMMAIETVHINSVITELASLLERIIGEQIKIEVALAGAVPPSPNTCLNPSLPQRRLVEAPVWVWSQFKAL